MVAPSRNSKLKWCNPLEVTRCLLATFKVLTTHSDRDTRVPVPAEKRTVMEIAVLVQHDTNDTPRIKLERDQACVKGLAWDEDLDTRNGGIWVRRRERAPRESVNVLVVVDARSGEQGVEVDALDRVSAVATAGETGWRCTDASAFHVDRMILRLGRDSHYIVVDTHGGTHDLAVDRVLPRPHSGRCHVRSASLARGHTAGQLVWSGRQFPYAPRVVHVASLDVHGVEWDLASRLESKQKTPADVDNVTRGNVETLDMGRFECIEGEFCAHEPVQLGLDWLMAPRRRRVDGVGEAMVVHPQRKLEQG